MLQIDITKKYALAVSGGIDSMTMLHMFASLSVKPDFYVVTVNHNIRKNAQSDCEFVENYCKSLGVECKTFFVDVPAYCKANKTSEETSARILRYGVFETLDCDFVCLAHHASDNAETVLMHVLRGSGASGARGIKAVNGKYLRPLLNITRSEIENYAAKHGVPYVEDSTNGETKYTRNFIRKNVMPVLTQLYPTAERNILRFAENVAQDDDYLDSLADISQVKFSSNSALIPINLLKSPAPVAYRVIKKTFRALGVYKDIEKTHLEALVNLAYGNGGKGVDLPFNYVATNVYDAVAIEQKTDCQSDDFEIPFAIGKTLTPLGTAEVCKTPLDNALRFDLNKMPENAVFRTKRQGDVFCKFGGGSKSLKKYLIDKKIPAKQRGGLVLAACGSEVLIICGVEISDKVKVTDSSDAYYIKVEK